MNDFVFNTEASKLYVTGTMGVGTIDSILTVNTVSLVQTVDTVNTVAEVQIVDTVSIVETVNTVSLVQTVDTVNTVAEVQIVDTVSLVQTINNAIIGGYTFTSDTNTATSGSATGTLFINKDISHIREGSIFFYNNSTSDSVTVSLRYSPVTTQTSYLPIDYINTVVPTSTATFMAISKLGHYTELTYTNGSTTPSIVAYYNAEGY